MEPILSIITPYYNSKRYIERFLNSLENQSSQNFELIIIDDRYSEEEFNYLKKIIKKYNFNYHIYRNRKNEGPGNTRNFGIKKSKAKYITFVDSDDYVTNNFVKEIEKIILTDKYDLVLFDYFSIANNKIKSQSSLATTETEPNISFAMALSKGMCWGKVYRNEIIKKYNLWFPDLMRSEDLAFTKIYMNKCKNCYYLKENLYYYFTSNSDSLMHRKDTLDISNNISAFNYIKENTNNKDAAEMIFLREYLYLIVQIMIIKDYNIKDILKFIDDSLLMYPQCFENPYLKYQPIYIRIILNMIKKRFIFPLKFIFKLKK